AEKSVAAVYAIGATTTTNAQAAHRHVATSARKRPRSRTRIQTSQRIARNGRSFRGWYVQNPRATVTPAATAVPCEARSPQRSSAARAAADEHREDVPEPVA